MRKNKEVIQDEILMKSSNGEKLEEYNVKVPKMVVPYMQRVNSCWIPKTPKPLSNSIFFKNKNLINDSDTIDGS